MDTILQVFEFDSIYNTLNDEYYTTYSEDFENL